MRVTDNEFRKQLRQYIDFRGIDIILHLRDGAVVELDKNRCMEGDVVIQNNRIGVRASIHIAEIRRAEFFAA
ncbi:MAG: hypothetical protein K1X75_04160 [Leptospirales bacterium]|nr:hypothetical protein [Leptospirales bacterium]